MNKTQIIRKVNKGCNGRSESLLPGFGGRWHFCWTGWKLGDNPYAHSQWWCCNSETKETLETYAKVDLDKTSLEKLEDVLDRAKLAAGEQMLNLLLKRRK